MDTKFSVAVHSLVLISESQVPINSNQIALSVGTNASYIRKILSLLKKSRNHPKPQRDRSICTENNSR